MKTNRTFWLIVAVCIAPVVASYLLYYGVRPEGRVNYGDLLEPQVGLSEIPLAARHRPKTESGFVDFLKALPSDDPRQALSRMSDMRGRWLLVRVGPAQCDQLCKDQLWAMRQIRIATGRERDRVERLWIVTDPSNPSLDSDWIKNYEGTWVMSAPNEATKNWPSQGPSPAAHIWLVDPLGNLMMRFPLEPDPAKMKSDLMRLLKASRIG